MDVLLKEQPNGVLLLTFLTLTREWFCLTVDADKIEEMKEEADKLAQSVRELMQFTPERTRNWIIFATLAELIKSLLDET